MQKIIQDDNYFKYIFKKTEKIACAVFYILRSDTNRQYNDVVVRDLEDTTMDVLDSALVSLSASVSTIEASVNDLKQSLIALESHLKIAHASRYIGTDVLAVFLHEIDTVYRAMRRYTATSVDNPFSGDTTKDDNGEQRLSRPRAKSETKEEGRVGGVPTLSRRQRVLDILRDNKGATIKDIAGIVTDCSEKTIQRELNALITDNLVVREGERRWSKYNLV